ncbi:MAG: short-subunit dehydrogenase, partial [Glaciecola sp.]
MAPKVLNVLIVGATSAIATEVARIYAAKGAQLFLL